MGTANGVPKYRDFYRPSYINLLRKAMIKKGMSYADIARIVGMSRQNVCAVFHGLNNYPPTVNKIARAVGIFFEQLVA